MPEIRSLAKADISKISEVMARAFYDDPVSCYIFPDAARRLKGLRRFFVIQLKRTYLTRGEAYTTVDLQGAALWMPPGSPRPGLRELVNQLPMIPVLGSRLVPTLRLIGMMESHHPHVHHYYLGTLGTDPHWQGKGVGSAMMGPVLSRCDSEGIPAYLESSKDRNVPFYRRHGFEVTGELVAPENGPKLWMMWREPVAPA